MLIDMLVLSLAIARVTVFLVNEEGPLNIMPFIRKWLDIQYVSEYGYVPTIGNGFVKDQLGQILTCPWCVSIYVSVFFVVIWWFFPATTFVLSLIFALSWAGPLGHFVFNRYE